MITLTPAFLLLCAVLLPNSLFVQTPQMTEKDARLDLNAKYYADMESYSEKDESEGLLKELMGLTLSRKIWRLYRSAVLLVQNLSDQVMITTGEEENDEDKMDGSSPRQLHHHNVEKEDSSSKVLSPNLNLHHPRHRSEDEEGALKHLMLDLEAFLNRLVKDFQGYLSTNHPLQTATVLIATAAMIAGAVLICICSYVLRKQRYSARQHPIPGTAISMSDVKCSLVNFTMPPEGTTDFGRDVDEAKIEVGAPCTSVVCNDFQQDATEASNALGTPGVKEVCKDFQHEATKAIMVVEELCTSELKKELPKPRASGLGNSDAVELPLTVIAVMKGFHGAEIEKEGKSEIDFGPKQPAEGQFLEPLNHMDLRSVWPGTETSSLVEAQGQKHLESEGNVQINAQNRVESDIPPSNNCSELYAASIESEYSSSKPCVREKAFMEEEPKANHPRDEPLESIYPSTAMLPLMSASVLSTVRAYAEAEADNINNDDMNMKAPSEKMREFRSKMADDATGAKSHVDCVEVSVTNEETDCRSSAKDLGQVGLESSSTESSMQFDKPCCKSNCGQTNETSEKVAVNSTGNEMTFVSLDSTQIFESDTTPEGSLISETCVQIAITNYSKMDESMAAQGFSDKLAGNLLSGGKGLQPVSANVYSPGRNQDAFMSDISIHVSEPCSDGQSERHKESTGLGSETSKQLLPVPQSFLKRTVSQLRDKYNKLFDSPRQLESPRTSSLALMNKRQEKHTLSNATSSWSLKEASTLNTEKIGVASEGLLLQPSQQNIDTLMQEITSSLDVIQARASFDRLSRASTREMNSTSHNDWSEASLAQTPKADNHLAIEKLIEPAVVPHASTKGIAAKISREFRRIFSKKNAAVVEQ